ICLMIAAKPVQALARQYQQASMTSIGRGFESALAVDSARCEEDGTEIALFVCLGYGGREQVRLEKPPF
ncbi:MAG TPA: hypothetical protein VE844_06980, partial [Gammaproteobacteria bacterium]|nr:hypothetical protein [Gammaproteobacteria bacterium]